MIYYYCVIMFIITITITFRWKCGDNSILSTTRIPVTKVLDEASPIPSTIPIPSSTPPKKLFK